MKRIFAASVCLVTLSIMSINALAQTESRDDVIKQIEAKRAEIAALEKRILVPSEEDRTSHSESLGQHDKGLIRLLPRETYDGVIAIRGGGSYYSFVKLTHAYGRGSDIALEQGFLSVGFAGADYGMLLNVGDAPLEEINTEHPKVKFLAAYSTVLEEPQARVEQRRFGGGTNIDGSMYSRRVRAQVKATYIVRSIIYSESDVLVAFRVIRKDTDGSLIIAWKMLKEFAIPDLARNPNQR